MPQISTHNRNLTEIVHKAWLGQCNHCSNMLEALKSIDICSTISASDTERSLRSTNLLRDQVRRRGEHRENKFGMKNPLYTVYALIG